MGWTAPRTWTDKEDIDEDILNPHIRDNLNYLKDTQDTLISNTVFYEGELVSHEGNAVTV